MEDKKESREERNKDFELNVVATCGLLGLAIIGYGIISQNFKKDILEKSHETIESTDKIKSKRIELEDKLILPKYKFDEIDLNPYRQERFQLLNEFENKGKDYLKLRGYKLPQ